MPTWACRVEGLSALDAIVDSRLRRLLVQARRRTRHKVPAVVVILEDVERVLLRLAVAAVASPRFFRGGQPLPHLFDMMRAALGAGRAVRAVLAHVPARKPRAPYLVAARYTAPRESCGSFGATVAALADPCLLVRGVKG